MMSDIRQDTRIHEGHPGDVRIRDGGFADIPRTSTDIPLPGGSHRAKLVRGYPRDLREASVLDMGIPMDVQCYTLSGVSVSGYLEEL